MSADSHCFRDWLPLIKSEGKKRSPLETPVQVLRSTRRVEEMCAWTVVPILISPHDVDAALAQDTARLVCGASPCR
jgi:hypothetical protein